MPTQPTDEGRLVLSTLSLIDVGGAGPEAVVADSDGTALYTGLADGRILRVDPVSGIATTVADTGGRPLGLRVAGDRLLICDHDRGLLAADLATGAVTELVTRYGGEPLVFSSNVDVTADGVIFFSQSTTRYRLVDYLSDIIEQTTSGRLYRLDPDGTCLLLLDDLCFANGVVVADDGSYVSVAETGARRVRRYWLTGAKAGTADLLVDDLPGYPDNSALDARGLLWIALADPINPLLEFMQSLPKPVRTLLAGLIRSLPARLHPPAKRAVGAVAVDAAGKIVHDIRFRTKLFRMTTGVAVIDETLFVSSLETEALGRLDLAALDRNGS